MNNAQEQLKVLLTTGTEEQVRDFIAEHFDELPEEVQQKLAVELFREAIAEETKELETTVALKEEAVKLIEAAEQE